MPQVRDRKVNWDHDGDRNDMHIREGIGQNIWGRHRDESLLRIFRNE